MIRTLSIAALAMALISPTAFGQNGPLQRVGRALDNAGRNIRNRVEMEVARGQISVEERDVLNRVMMRLEWDKQLIDSSLHLEAHPGGAIVLKGSVLNETAKARAVDLVQNTIGVAKVVDELAVVKNVKVIETPPATTTLEPAPVIESRPAPTVTVPEGTKVIVKP